MSTTTPNAAPKKDVTPKQPSPTDKKEETKKSTPSQSKQPQQSRGKATTTQTPQTQSKQPQTQQPVVKKEEMKKDTLATDNNNNNDDFPDRRRRRRRKGGRRSDSTEPKIEADPEKRIPVGGPYVAYIGNISYSATNKDVELFFKPLEAKNVTIPFDERKKINKGFAYCEFKSKEDLLSSLKWHGKEMNERTVRVDVSNNSGKKPVPKEPKDTKEPKDPKEKSSERPPREPKPRNLVIPEVGPFEAHLGNLAYEVKEDDIIAFFKGMKIEKDAVSLPSSKKYKGVANMGYGYVRFATKDELKKALEYNDKELMARKVRVSVSKKAGMKPKVNVPKQYVCIVCNEKERDVVFRECGHLVCCEACVNEKKIVKCPVCQKDIKEKIKILYK